MMKLVKAFVLATWAFVLANLVIGYPGVWGTIATWGLVVLVVSHLAETALVFKKIKSSSEPFWPNLVASLIFGHAHNVRYFKKKI